LLYLAILVTMAAVQSRLFHIQTHSLESLQPNSVLSCNPWQYVCSPRLAHRSTERGLNIVGTYVENESGAKLARPELFRLLADSKPGDLLVEQVDRLSRLTDSDWRKLADRLPRPQVAEMSCCSTAEEITSICEAGVAHPKGG
jgi:hypothetical protein